MNTCLYKGSSTNTEEYGMLPKFNKEGQSAAEIYPLSCSILECCSCRTIFRFSSTPWLTYL